MRVAADAAAVAEGGIEETGYSNAGFGLAWERGASGAGSGRGCWVCRIVRLVVDYWVVAGDQGLALIPYLERVAAAAACRPGASFRPPAPDGHEW